MLISQARRSGTDVADAADADVDPAADAADEPGAARHLESALSSIDLLDEVSTCCLGTRDAEA